MTMKATSNAELIRFVVLIAMAPAIGLGIARFAYALLLPEMKLSLGWTYSEAGWMNTINAAGYLIGALLTALLAKRFSLIWLVQGGVLVSVIAILLTGFFEHFFMLSALRFLAGVSGALCFVAGGAIAATLAVESSNRSGLILSLFYAGPGVGIVLSGLLVPFYMDHFGSDAWAAAWWFLGFLAFVLAMLSFSARLPRSEKKAQQTANLPPFRLLKNAPVLMGYLAFGAGYIGYMTFMFAYLKQAGASTVQLASFWATIGGASMLSPWIWGAVMAKGRNGTATAFLTFVTLVGSLMPLLSTSYLSLFASAAIFGSAFFSVPAATTAFAKRNADPSEWPYVIGVFTVVFGLGQVLGPVLSGYISDSTGKLYHGLIWGCVFLVIGVILPLLQKDAQHR